MQVLLSFLRLSFFCYQLALQSVQLALSLDFGFLICFLALHHLLELRLEVLILCSSVGALHCSFVFSSSPGIIKALSMLLEFPLLVTPLFLPCLRCSEVVGSPFLHLGVHLPMGSFVGSY